MLKSADNLNSLKRIKDWLDEIFPKNNGGPFWEQEPYKSDLFKIFREIYSNNMPHNEMIMDYLKDNWKALPEKQSKELENILNAWNEWQYAIDHFQGI